MVPWTMCNNGIEYIGCYVVQLGQVHEHVYQISLKMGSKKKQPAIFEVCQPLVLQKMSELQNFEEEQTLFRDLQDCQDDEKIVAQTNYC